MLWFSRFRIAIWFRPACKFEPGVPRRQRSIYALKARPQAVKRRLSRPCASPPGHAVSSLRQTSGMRAQHCGAGPNLPSCASSALLPAELGTFLTLIRKSSEPLQWPWRLVAQAVGVGYLRLEGNDTGALLNVLQDLRKNLETRGGSLVILRCPLEIKSKMDVWGSSGDALALMRSIKAQFDPTGVLNPGRFIGGI